MSTDGAFGRPRLLPSLLGLLLLLMGLALLAGGVKLLSLGGSLYYLVAGVVLAVTGVLLLLGRAAAIGLYALFLLGSTLWAWYEVGLDWWQLVPRLALWTSTSDRGNTTKSPPCANPVQPSNSLYMQKR